MCVCKMGKIANAYGGRKVHAYYDDGEYYYDDDRGHVRNRIMILPR